MIGNNEFLLTLIRHGESEVNATPDIVGQLPNVQLTSKGRDQARKLRARFLHKKENFDFIYSSTYDRALQTAQLAIPDPGQGITTVYDLREYHAGEWTGGSRSKILTPEVKMQMNNLNLSFLPPGGESLNMVERRSSAWLDQELIYNPKFAGKKPLSIACFSHGQVIKSLLHHIVGFDKSIVWKIQINNTSLTRLYLDQNGWHLLSVNDCFHLEV
jgi:broad specificity phosphatase PhoE